VTGDWEAVITPPHCRPTSRTLRMSRLVLRCLIFLEHASAAYTLEVEWSQRCSEAVELSTSGKQSCGADADGACAGSA